MKKGFTLIELLGVILLLALVIMVSFPLINKYLNESNEKVNNAVNLIVFDSVEEYLNDNKNTYPKYSGNVYCLDLKLLVTEGYVADNILDKKQINQTIKINVMSSKKLDYEIVPKNKCQAKKQIN